jgi:hypothetical protein
MISNDMISNDMISEGERNNLLILLGCFENYQHIYIDCRWGACSECQVHYY